MRAAVLPLALLAAALAGCAGGTVTETVTQSQHAAASTPAAARAEAEPAPAPESTAAIVEGSCQLGYTGGDDSGEVFHGGIVPSGVVYHELPVQHTAGGGDFHCARVLPGRR